MPLMLDWFTHSGEASNRSRHEPLRFTTIANWYQPGEFEWKGQIYLWSKHTQFLKFIDLPHRVGQPIELALGSVDEDSTRLLISHGWRVIDAAPVGKEILPFRSYIFNSDAEFTVAKDDYVRLRTGWFSDRSAYYLAAGKPVITQETGFSRFLPTGEGLLAFNTMDEAVAAFEAVQSDYHRHSRAARAIAEECFRAEKVLAKLIDGIGL